MNQKRKILLPPKIRPQKEAEKEHLIPQSSHEVLRLQSNIYGSLLCFVPRLRRKISEKKMNAASIKKENSFLLFQTFKISSS
jgi:hypothetical protein